MDRVLLVEDSPTQAARLAFVLEDAGFEVEVRADGEAAWARLQGGPVDAVLTDLLLPGDSGFALCRRIKGDEALRHLPVVVVTAQDDPANVLRGLAAGADGFMTKDREPAEIVGRLRRALERARALDEGEAGVVEFLGQRFTVDASRARLLDVLVSAFEDVVRLNRRNEETIGELRRAETRIRSLNAELEQRVAQLATSNRELESFSYSLSHDLRAPLRSMTTFTEFLMRDHGDALDERAREYVQRILGAGDRMGRLIDAMLSLAQATRASLQRAHVDLAAEARLIARELRRAQPQRAVEFEICPTAPVEGDPDLLRVVLQNLLGNAWKYTAKRAQARIEFGTTVVDGQPACFVRDDGAGFDMAHADKLFAAFHRLHATRDFEGTGIGLATVRRIVERHGGRVWGEGAVERGATFYFTLPTPRDLTPP